MNMLSDIRLQDFEALATKTANCLLGFECETESNVAESNVGNSSGAPSSGFNRDNPTAAGGKLNTSNVSTDSANIPASAQSQDNKAQTQDNKFVDHAKKVNAEITDALSQMASKNKQQKMNSMSKGPYFLIFIVGLLLMGFSLSDDEEE